ncbi:hypothetical protein GCM10022214_69140 [Actinomadura miaoliensis]|uniref:Uncharacterized protein n=1 Tax=Actinomadura miaoliensis TaxID=430685 RepID=A0ABP7WSR9_9ACTN
MSEATIPATASTLTIPPERGADVEFSTWFSFPINSNVYGTYNVCHAQGVYDAHHGAGGRRVRWEGRMRAVVRRPGE